MAQLLVPRRDIRVPPLVPRHPRLRGGMRERDRAERGLVCLRFLRRTLRSSTLPGRPGSPPTPTKRSSTGRGAPSTSWSPSEPIRGSPNPRLLVAPLSVGAHGRRCARCRSRTGGFDQSRIGSPAKGTRFWSSKNTPESGSPVQCAGLVSQRALDLAGSTGMVRTPVRGAVGVRPFSGLADLQGPGTARLRHRPGGPRHPSRGIAPPARERSFARRPVSTGSEGPRVAAPLSS